MLKGDHSQNSHVAKEVPLGDICIVYCVFYCTFHFNQLLDFYNYIYSKVKKCDKLRCLEGNKIEYEIEILKIIITVFTKLFKQDNLSKSGRTLVVVIINNLEKKSSVISLTSFKL